MSDFDHGAWARAKAELALIPLPACGRSVVDRLLSGEVIRVDSAKFEELDALRRLHAAGVIRYHQGWSYSEANQLRAAAERGIIDELFT